MLGFISFRGLTYLAMVARTGLVILSTIGSQCRARVAYAHSLPTTDDDNGMNR